MLDETVQRLTALANALHTSRRQKFGGYVLFIGGGASTIEGQPAIDELRRQVLISESFSSSQIENMSYEDQKHAFDRIWSEDWGNAQKLVQWRALHEKLKPTKGLIALASLLSENYFPFVLTSTVDRLVESVFIGSTVQEGKPLRQWSVLVNGVDDQDAITEAIQDHTPDAPETIFLKLCGDIRSGTFAVTQEEIQEKANNIRDVLNGLRRSAFIFIGFTAIDDLMIPYFPEAMTDRVIFIGAQRPDERSNFEKHRWGQQRPRYIVDPDLTFDLIFQTIATRLNVYQEYEEVTGTTLNTEAVERMEQTAPPPQASTENLRPSTEALVQIFKTVERQPVGPTNAQSPIFEVVEATTLTVKTEANRQVSFDLIGGNFNYTSPDLTEWDIDIVGLNSYMQDIGSDIVAYYDLQDQPNRDRWRRNVKREGVRLYKDLILAYPDLKSKLDLAHQTVDNPQNLTLVFSGPRDFLGMPYELLYDDKQPQPLVLSHPLCHKVNGVNLRHPETFDAFINKLRLKKEPLRVLLIASDANTLTTNQEITELKSLIEAKAERNALIDVECTLLRAEEASLQEVRNQLTSCSYHIVHYAGHGLFDDTTGENSSLCFWQQTNRGRERAFLTARELASLMVGGETRLFYLSTCVGAWTGNVALLRENDYLGLMDALVFGVGVPYVLGFRWSVADDASRNFARTFYNQLFTRPLVPEHAVWHARKQVYQNDGVDETWISPVLVAQNPYR